MIRRLPPAVLLALLPALAAAILAPALALAHPLGNFTVNRYSRLEISPRTITVHYALDLAEIPTFQAMPFLDPNGTGVVTPAAKEAYATQRLDGILANLRLTLGDGPVPLRVTSWDLELRPGQGNLPTLWLGATLSAPTPATLARAGAAGLSLSYRDQNEPDRIGWREIVVQGVDGVAVVDSSVSAKDVSDELRSYPANMLAKPLNEREASATIVAPGFARGGIVGAVPAALGAVPGSVGSFLGEATAALAALAGGSAESSVAPSAASDTAPGLIGAVLGQASSLGKIVSAGRLGPTAIALAFLIAMLWGMAHAFTPGHGKTIVAAYLVGSRGTARHALYLGLTVTATHTIGIYALGLLTLFATRFILPDSLYPWLSLLSGLAVLAVGVITLVGRARSFGRAPAGHDDHTYPRDHDHTHPRDHAPDHGHVHDDGPDAHRHDGCHQEPLLVGVEHVHAADGEPGPVHPNGWTPGLAAALSAIDGHAHPHDGEPGHAHDHGDHPHAHHHPDPGDVQGHAHSHEQGAPGHARAQDHDHGDDAHPDHPPHHEEVGLLHDHGDGRLHRHLPPGADGGPVTWRSLLALGIAGGILPCPSALVLLLGAIALGQVAFGLALVVVFSIGLAGVLIGIGLAFVYARQWVTARSVGVPFRLGRLWRLAPIGSAALIALIGLGITVEALGQLALRGWL